MKHNGKYVKIAIGASLAFALIIVGVALAAPVAIDTFDDGYQFLIADYIYYTVEASVTGAMVGGERDTQVNWLSGSDLVELRIDYSDSNNFVFSQGPGVTGNALLQWDGGDGNIALNATGLNHKDLTDVGHGLNDCFVLRVLANDSPVAVTLRVYTNGTNWSRYTIDTPGNIPGGSVVDLVIPFTSFTIGGVGVANFADVGAVEMFVDGSLNQGADVSLDFFEARAVRDYGDLPEGYPVSLLVENGARHIPQGLRLGARVDTEADGVHSPLANLDDTTDAADEDGVVRPAINWTLETGGHLDVTVAGCPGTCYLNGWINWNTIGTGSDTDFSDAGEHVFIDREIIGNGTKRLDFDVPVDPSNNAFDARFRLCSTSATCNVVTGEVIDGEVEDYHWLFGPTAISLVSVTAHSRLYNSTHLLLGISVLLVIGAAGIFTLAKRRKL